jgi:hypothetical protein
MSVGGPGPVDISIVVVIVLFDMDIGDWCLPLRDEESAMTLLCGGGDMARQFGRPTREHRYR